MMSSWLIRSCGDLHNVTFQEFRQKFWPGGANLTSFLLPQTCSPKVWEDVLALRRIKGSDASDADAGFALGLYSRS